MQIAQADALAGVSSSIQRATARLYAPRDAAARPAFDPDYGDYIGNPMDPRTTDALDGFMTPDEAHDQALMDCQRMPALVVDWLGKTIGDAAPAWETVDTAPMRDRDADLSAAPIGLLLATLFGEFNEPALRALHELRLRFSQDCATDITERARDLLAEHGAPVEDDGGDPTPEDAPDTYWPFPLGPWM
jgi:hypothetical protein